MRQGEKMNSNVAIVMEHGTRHVRPVFTADRVGVWVVNFRGVP
jgi:acyl dehydratase